ncbi:MAG: PASTA domain-containing protein [Clostridia bacterium]|nr:PASTA domain-containing protein [Clostridia bacterium]
MAEERPESRKTENGTGANRPASSQTKSRQNRSGSGTNGGEAKKQPSTFRKLWRRFTLGPEVTQKTQTRRIRVALLLLLVLLAGIAVRFAYLQLVDPYHYADRASNQYTYQSILPAKRGTIFASDGTTKLASSGIALTVFLSPSDIQKFGKEGDDTHEAPGEDAQIRMISEGLAECLTDVTADYIRERYEGLGEDKNRYKYQVVKKNVSEDEEKKVRQFISDNGLSLQVCFEEVGKRIYPYGSLAAQMIGFVGSDGNGLTGIEYRYDDVLRGTNGRSVRARDANGNELAYNYDLYVEAEDGLNVVTTIDWTIQSVVEKYIERTYREFKPTGRVSCLVMDIKTGELLASGIYPSYDLNEHSTLSEEYQKQLDAFRSSSSSGRSSGTNSESSEAAVDPELEIQKKESELLNEMWANTVATQTYEPGSTFKVITAAIALQTGSITKEETFNCGRHITVSDQTIHCWSKVDHGYQDLKASLVNSCNPALAQIGMKIGATNFLKFFEEFGYTGNSGSDVLGEVSSIYYETTGQEFHNVELSVYSFGQTFKVTMLQHLAGLSSIANGGYLVVPHVAKYLTDANGNIVKTFPTETVRQVVSSRVCSEIMEMLVNSTKNACVNGYNIVAKTGTSEKRDTKEDDYVSSCVAFAPAEEPKIAILVTVDNPDQTFGYYGSTVAAPCVGNVLSEVLPYLGIAPNSDSSYVKTVRVGDYRGETVDEARAAVEALGLNCTVLGDGMTVNTQSPRGDSIVTYNGSVYLYTGEQKAEETVSVPKLTGSTPEAAMKSLLQKGLNVNLEGVFGDDTKGCHVEAQSVPSGQKVAPGTLITLTCRYDAVND